jgi:hypothetical protein
MLEISKRSGQILTFYYKTNSSRVLACSATLKPAWNSARLTKSSIEAAKTAAAVVGNPGFRPSV